MFRDLQSWASMSHVCVRKLAAPVSDAWGGIRRVRAHRRFPHRRRGSRLFPSRRRHCLLGAGRSSPAGYRPWQLPHFGADGNSSAKASRQNNFLVESSSAATRPSVVRGRETARLQPCDCPAAVGSGLSGCPPLRGFDCRALGPCHRRESVRGRTPRSANRSGLAASLPARLPGR